MHRNINISGNSWVIIPLGQSPGQAFSGAQCSLTTNISNFKCRGFSTKYQQKTTNGAIYIAALNKKKPCFIAIFLVNLLCRGRHIKDVFLAPARVQIGAPRCRPASHLEGESAMCHLESALLPSHKEKEHLSR